MAYAKLETGCYRSPPHDTLGVPPMSRRPSARTIAIETEALRQGSAYLDRCEREGRLPDSPFYGPGQVSAAVAALQGNATLAQ